MSVILVPNVHAPAKETLPISQVPPHSMRSITFVDMAQESPCRSRRLVLEGGGNMRGMSALNFLSSFFWFFLVFFFTFSPVHGLLVELGAIGGTFFACVCVVLCEEVSVVAVLLCASRTVCGPTPSDTHPLASRTSRLASARTGPGASGSPAASRKGAPQTPTSRYDRLT